MLFIATVIHKFLYKNNKMLNFKNSLNYDHNYSQVSRITISYRSW